MEGAEPEAFTPPLPRPLKTVVIPLLVGTCRRLRVLASLSSDRSSGLDRDRRACLLLLQGEDEQEEDEELQGEAKGDGLKGERRGGGEEAAEETTLDSLASLRD